jgi:predicted transcriptional regulator
VIKLTVAEQAYQLSLQNQTVPQIANQLSTTVAAVNSYLEIINST